MLSAFKNLILSRDSKVNGVFAMIIVSLIVLGCACPKNVDLGNTSSGSNSNSSSSSNSVFGDDSDSGDVDDNLAKATVKATTAQFANAIATEDFSSLYNGTATEFKSQYSEDQLKNEFRDFIRQKKNLLPILAKAVSMDPEYTDGPSAREESAGTLLTASGKYPTKPLPVTFKYEYVKRGGKWWLLTLEVYVR
jgi:hypothetical protein